MFALLPHTARVPGGKKIPRGRNILKETKGDKGGNVDGREGAVKRERRSSPRILYEQVSFLPLSGHGVLLLAFLRFAVAARRFEECTIARLTLRALVYDVEDLHLGKKKQIGGRGVGC